MGCLQPKQHTRIVPMQTSHNDSVFTSTTDIHSLYNFGKVLGIGSFGKVVQATMKNNSMKQYAIKIIDKNNLHGKETQLANEIYTLKKLDHPNIIKFYEVYQSEIYIYICMEYCEGGELVERIAKQQINLTEHQVQRIISKICSAIVYIHEKGIVHRDIKAENILFTEQSLYSEPKLIDFGFANKFDIVHRRRKLKTFIGTPLYMPPEVIEGDYDEKCDVWSLGVLLYSLLCGFPPFVGQSKEKLFQNIRVKDIKFESKVWNTISQEAKDLLSQMLSKDPQQRLSAKQCLDHPWFQTKYNPSLLLIDKMKNTQIQQDRTIYQMLKTYRGGAKFKKEVTKVLINQMNESELQHLKQIFSKIDVDNSGTITVEELKAALIKEGSIVTHWEIEQLIQTIILEEDEGIQFTGEQEGNQFLEIKSPKPLMIKYTDFLAACIDQRKLFTRERLWSLFKYFDTLNVGHIQKDDIREALARHGRQISESNLNEMINEINPNNNNQISFDEFCQMMCDQGIDKTMNIKDEFKEPPSRVD
ncbi:unnamed protein product [Paramecium sonneborni]|uniref:Protein kinase domain containing protein n=1 Tax=Paramecium sonneborni TaxID=65129 RepID=A0A8S1LPU3_9CILI|nr:unnamed protein product [Paramecium sonneborni]